MRDVFKWPVTRRGQIDYAAHTELQRRAEISACTGNCNQGRMCDCVPDVDDKPASMGDGAGVFLWPLATIGLCLLVYFLRVVGVL